MGALDGKVACITGGTRGTAEAFLREGARVVVNGRGPDKGAAAIEEMDAGDRAHFIAGDVKRRADREAIVAGTVERYGGIDILFANAGGASGHAPVAELTDEALLEAFAQESSIERLNTVEEVAAVAVHLASSSARNITGCMFPVDGGTLPY